MKKAKRLFAGVLCAVMIGMMGASHAEQHLPASVAMKPMMLQTFGPIAVRADDRTVSDGCVIPGGMPFGIKMFTDGVMVVGLADLVSDGHTVNPAKAAGIRPGDVITSINGEPVGSNEDVARIVSGSAGGTLRLCITRETREEKELTLCPVLCDDGLGYKAGMWVRDSSAGIGTMTWLDPESGMFAGLGHAVCDIDTGDRMPLYSGEAVNVTITGVTRGESGRPGELRGTFSGGVPIGILTRNDITGVYGRLEGTKDFAQQAQLPIARREEIRTGKACIRATVDGGGVKEYEIVIERIDLREDHPTRNMVLRITDPKLLAVTGGIVQGMSGSPIIQDGKLVGAVTHVLVNDPTRGYGIFIENMVEAAAKNF